MKSEDLSISSAIPRSARDRCSPVAVESEREAARALSANSETIAVASIVLSLTGVTLRPCLN